MSDRKRSTDAATAAQQRAPGRRTGFWEQTTQRVGQAQKSRFQFLASEHPIAFAAVWGLKCLVWDLPRGLAGLIAKAWRSCVGRSRATASVSSIEDARGRR